MTKCLRLSLSDISVLGKVLLLGILCTGIVQAQTGKIAGKIVDAQFRTPLPGVNVIIEGTSLGAATDTDGDYFIINISPGLYTVQASFIGYATQTKTEVRVQADRTVVVDFVMGSQAVQGEEVTITAEREIVKMDLSGSQTHIEAEEFTTSPVTNVVDYLQIQEGVEFTTSAQGQWLSIRGGGREETDFYVDGMSTMNANTANAYIGISRTAIREVAVQTGGFNAEYGRVRSGFVNVVTRDGSRQEYTMAMEGQYSFPHLKHFGRNLYDNRNPYYISRIGQNNFIPEGSTERTNYGLNGEVALDPNSPEYRGWSYVNDTEGKFAGYTWRDANGAVIPYTQEEIDRYSMTPFVYAQKQQFQGWQSVSNVTLADNNIANDMLPAEIAAQWMIEHQPRFYGHKPDYALDVTTTGPLPGSEMNNRLGELLSTSTFMLSYRSQTSQLTFPASRRDFKDRNIQAKITSNLQSNTKLRLNAVYGEVESVSDFQQLETSYGGGFFKEDGTLGARAVLSGNQGGGRFPGAGIDFAWDIFNEGAYQLNDAYWFQTSARLTHTVSPRTYLELEFQYQQNTDNVYPMWAQDELTNRFWIYNMDGMVNERGEPRTFITSDPADIFPDGTAQRLDPVLRSQIQTDPNGLSSVPAGNRNARNRPFSMGGELTWPYSRELIASWFDDGPLGGEETLKGPSRLAMVLGEVPWEDPALLPGYYDWDNFYNSQNGRPNILEPQNGGLVDNMTLPGVTLVMGSPRYAGFRAGSGTDRLNEYNTGDGSRNVNNSRVRSAGGTLTLVSQATKHNQLKSGVDFRFYQYKTGNNHSQGVPHIPSEFGAYSREWNFVNDNPFELSAYLQDKIEVQGLIANVGIRMDLFDPTTKAIDFNDPFDPAFRTSQFETTAPTHFEQSGKVRGDIKVRFSPRLGLSFPVTEMSKVYFNYGWFYQRPTLAQLFHYRNVRTLTGGEPAQVPNVNLDWPRTMQMEMGYEQNIKGWFLFHAAGYFKDSDDLLNQFTWINLLGDGRLASLVAGNYSDVRGIEFRAEKNYGLFRTRMNYNIMVRSRGAIGSSTLRQSKTQEYADTDVRLRNLNEEYYRPLPNFRGTLGFFSPRRWGPSIGERFHPLDNLVLNLIYTWNDQGQRLHEQGITPDKDIWVDFVNRSNTDLRAEKRIGIGRQMNLGLFVQVYNLWDQKYLENFSEKYGESFRYQNSEPPGNDKYGEYKPEHLGATLDWWRDNTLFSNKRDVLYGISFTYN